MEMMFPVWDLKSSWTANDTSVQVRTTVKSSILRIRGLFIVSLKKVRTRRSFAQSCSAAFVTRLVKNAIGTIMSGLPRFVIQRSFCTSEWRHFRLGSGSKSEFGSTSKQPCSIYVSPCRLYSRPICNPASQVQAILGYMKTRAC